MSSGSPLSALVYYNFIKIRYQMSADMQNAVLPLKQLLNDPRCPSFIRSIGTYMAG